MSTNQDLRTSEASDVDTARQLPADASVLPAREIDGELWIRAADVQAITKQHAEIMVALQKDRDHWRDIAQNLMPDYMYEE